VTGDHIASHGLARSVFVTLYVIFVRRIIRL
jgi:hypothetical protein